MVSQKGLKSSESRSIVRIHVSRWKNLRVVAVTACLYRLLPKTVLVTLEKIVRLRNLRDVLALHEVPVFAAEMTEQLASKEVSELLSYHLSRRLTLDELDPLVQIVVLVHDNVSPLTHVSSGTLRAHGTGEAGVASRTLFSVGSVGTLRPLSAR